MWERAFGVHTNSEAKSLALGGLGPGPGHGWPLLGQRLSTLLERKSSPNPCGCHSLCVMKMDKDGRIWPR